MSKQIALCDSTLRDGSYGIMHSFTKENISQITAGLAAAGVDLIEIGHGDGSGGSTITYGRSLLTQEEMLKAALPNKGRSKLGVLCLPGIGVMREVAEAQQMGIDWVRVAAHAPESDIMEQHIKQSKKLGLFVVGMLASSHVLTLPETLMHAKRLEDYGADVIHLADSCGTMFPEDIRARFEMLSAEIKTPLGFHGHNNLTLGVANSLAAAGAGASYLDGACRGMGAGAGNAQSEVLLGCLMKLGYQSNVDLYKLMDVAEDVVEPVLRGPQTVRNLALIIGYVGTYGSFLIHSQKAAQRFNLDPRNIIKELGRRKMVMGQEDMIIDIAYQMSQENKN